MLDNVGGEMADMAGTGRVQYRALNTLEYPTDPAVIARILAGERLAYNKRGPIKRVRPGDIVDDIPAVSLPGLLARRDIEAVSAAATTATEPKEG